MITSLTRDYKRGRWQMLGGWKNWGSGRQRAETPGNTGKLGETR